MQVRYAVFQSSREKGKLLNANPANPANPAKRRYATERREKVKLLNAERRLSY